MTLETSLRAFKSFDLANSEASIWVFKKRPVATDGVSPFTAVSVATSEALQQELKRLVAHYQGERVEADPYSLLAQPSEGGMLGIASRETLFPFLQRIADQPAAENYAQSVKQLNNAVGYLFRLRCGANVLYCVKKASSDWSTKKSRSLLNFVFHEQELDIQENPAFTIGRSFDFFAIDDDILMCNKASFESILNHKETYSSAFAELRQEPAFNAAFTELSPIVDYVGTNAIQLRRMAVVKARAYYNNPDYLTRLQTVSRERGWGLNFDETGRIVPTPETARTIIQVLLDHRLRSELSHNTYDVPSTIAVA